MFDSNGKKEKKSEVDTFQWTLSGVPLREYAMCNRVSARGLVGIGGSERPKAVLEWGHERSRQKVRIGKR